jgi:hypothetical protein
MASKKDRAARELQEFFEASKRQAVPRLAAEMRKWVIEADPASNLAEPDWDDPYLRGQMASNALTLNLNRAIGPVVASAFKKAGLDPKNPLHWRYLLDMFCVVHFRPRPRAGRPQEWATERQLQLLADFRKVRMEKPDRPDAEVFRALKKRHPHRYRQSEGRLAKELKRAQDPKFNEGLAQVVDFSVQMVRAGYMRRGSEWNADVEAKEYKAVLERVLSWIGPPKRGKNKTASG